MGFILNICVTFFLFDYVFMYSTLSAIQIKFDLKSLFSTPYHHHFATVPDNKNPTVGMLCALILSVSHFMCLEGFLCLCVFMHLFLYSFLLCPLVFKCGKCFFTYSTLSYSCRKSALQIKFDLV